MISYVASDLEVDLEEKALKPMWKICAANQAEHKLLWSDQGEKSETLDRWSMRLQIVLQFIQPRLAPHIDSDPPPPLKNNLANLNSFNWVGPSATQ